MKLKNCLIGTIGMIGAMMFAFNPMTVKAEENANVIVCTEEQAGEITYEDIKDDLIALPENVGETKVVACDEEGVLTVTLLDSTESNTRSTSKVSKKTYGFQYTTVLGEKKLAYEVYLTCNWTEDGENSKINSFNGEYKEIDGGYSCEWTDSSYTENLCMLELKVSKTGVGTGYYRFTAYLTVNEDKYINFDYILL